MLVERCLCAAVPILVAACHGPTKEPAAAGTVTAATSSTQHGGAVTQHGGAVTRGPLPALAERMPRCPNVVAGATTIVSEVPGGVELLITAEGDGAREIRERAAALPAAAEETRGEHQASGAMNARFGRCPVVMRNTKLEVHEIPGGAAIVVRPSSPTQLAWVRREVEARAAQIGAPRPFGAGLMKRCPSAVPNAATLVIDRPYGVDVKVTAAAAEDTEAIRARAKELAAHGAAPGSRCPESAADTTMSAAEIPGGVTITIRARRTDQVTTLRRDVHDRARSYDPPMTSSNGAASGATGDR